VSFLIKTFGNTKLPSVVSEVLKMKKLKNLLKFVVVVAIVASVQAERLKCVKMATTKATTTTTQSFETQEVPDSLKEECIGCPIEILSDFISIKNHIGTHDQAYVGNYDSWVLDISPEELQYEIYNTLQPKYEEFPACASCKEIVELTEAVESLLLPYP
jgi:hypothetical protein